MKLIPHTHTAAFHWINQAWALLEISPLETAELLAGICGFQSWEDLAQAIGKQSVPGAFMSLTAERVASLSTQERERFKKQQRATIMKKRMFTDEFFEDFEDTLCVLDLESISNTCSGLQTSLSQLLEKIVDPTIGEVEEQFRSLSQTSDAPSLERKVKPLQYLKFAEAMGWSIEKSSFVSSYTPYDVSFYAKDKAGNQIPVFIFPLSTKPSDKSDLIAMGIKKKIATLADLAEWSRVILFWGECFTLSDNQGNYASCIGSLLEKTTWMDMLVSPRTDSIEALFDMNKQAGNDLGKGSQLPSYALDVNFYAAATYTQHIHYDDQ